MNKINESGFLNVETDAEPAVTPPAPKKMSKMDDELITALFDLLADIKEKRPLKTE